MSSIREKDYNNYDLSKIEFSLSLIGSIILCALISYVFYGNRFYMIILLILPGFYGPKLYKEYKVKKQKNQINQEFCEALYALSASVKSGKSFENSILEVIKDLKIQYHQDTYIIQEFYLIHRKLEYRMTLSEAFENFARRSHSEEIMTFSQILKINQLIGGDTSAILKKSALDIALKFQIKQEISVLLEGKKHEIKALILMPILIMMLLNYSVQSYMAPVFNTTIGWIGTTIALLFITTGVFLAFKILRIKI